MEVVQRLSHISVCSKYDGLKTLLVVCDLLLLADDQKPLEYVCVRDLGVTHNGAAALDRLNDLGRLVAGEREASRAGVDLAWAMQDRSVVWGKSCHS